MYVFEISDIMFFITNIKNPTSNFNITSHAELGVTRYQSSALLNNYYFFGVEVI